MKHQPLVVGIRSHVVGLDPATGSELWRAKLKGGQIVTTLTRKSRVFAGVGGELFAIDRTTGNQLWNNKLKGLGFNLIAFAADPSPAPRDLIIGMRSHLIAIDPTTGAERWRTRLGSRLGSDHVTVAIADDQAVLGASSGELFCVNRSSGSIVWMAGLKGLGVGLVTLGPGEMASAAAIVNAQRAAAAAG